ncbi:pyridoxal phosphate-dependent transferase [Ilyonectria robusta]|uniref:pyridoxal phosphate-dependent transferase n=1 Tax=Ilyonectria robusta TaxID=1079257 RepID=UPI001E8EBD05|nr:pyridoxal phosphate-dependent transferase [Ilyonectria robusta]KAH8688084.1 pyridoxal phosphate-dependent transferase [Ilyonectria robusta]
MTAPKPAINFIRGWPAPELLPAPLLSAAAQRILADPAVYVPALQYGPDPGYQPLREALARWLAGHYGLAADPERICITGGASQNVACILQSFTDPAVTRAVWMVAPTYHLACGIFDDAGFAGRLRAFPEDEEGIDLEVLEAKIRKLEDEEVNEPQAQPFKDAGEHRKFYRHVIYVVPTCSNPSGKTMSVRRREGLVRLARKYDALVICDDVYDLLQWPLNNETSSGSLRSDESPEMTLPRLCDIDLAMDRDPKDPKGFGFAVSNGSFSKMAGPGVRTGWLEGSPAFSFGLAQTASSKSGGAPSQFCAAMMSDLVESGALQDYLATTVRPGLQRRHRLLVDAIHEHLSPQGITIREAGLVGGSTYGGYFVWLKLPQGLSAKLIADVSLVEENLIVGNGNMFQVHGDEKTVDLDGAIRVTFAYVPEDDLVEGIRRLGAVVQRVKADPAKYEKLANTVSDAAMIDSSK